MRLLSVSWMVGAVLAGMALGWQLSYELATRQCIKDSEGLLALCQGSLDDWVLPVTLVAALVLVAMGVWRLVPPPRD